MIVDIVEHYSTGNKIQGQPWSFEVYFISPLSCYFSPLSKDSQWRTLLEKIQAYTCYVLTVIKGTREKSCLSVIQSRMDMFIYFIYYYYYYKFIRGRQGKHFDMKTKDKNVR